MSDGTLDSARCLSPAIDAGDAHRTSSAPGSGTAGAQSRHGQATSGRWTFTQSELVDDKPSFDPDELGGSAAVNVDAWKGVLSGRHVSGVSQMCMRRVVRSSLDAGDARKSGGSERPS